MSTFAILALVLATVAAMEGVAWASHKYIMHGFGWAWHRDHHEPYGHRLEKNERFALVGAAMSTPMFTAGSTSEERVGGQNVSELVVLGGRRIIKKKN